MPTLPRRLSLPYGLELGSVLALGLAAGGLFAFVKLAGEVKEGDTRSFDQAILLALRRSGDRAEPIGPLWLKQVMTDLTALGGFTVLGLLTIVVFFYLIMIRKRGAATLLAVSILGGTLLSTLLKQLFERPRPDLVAHMVEVQTLSFPSGHAMLSAITYLTLGVLLARLSPSRRVKAYVVGVAVALTLLVGCSRVYLGVHWPTDVLGGWCAGAVWALLCWQVAVILQRRGDVERAEDPPDPGDLERVDDGSLLPRRNPNAS